MNSVRIATTLSVLAALSATARPGDLPPEVVGQWSAPMSWGVLAIHSVMLPTGEVLQWSYPTGNPIATTWDPASGVFTPTGLSVDLFCAGQSLLADGSVFVTGGNDPVCDFRGRVDTHIYSPFTNSWTRLGDMAEARWYPRNITLGDGSVLITSGLNLNCEVTPVMERFVPGAGLQTLPEGLRFLNLFPWLHQLPGGEIAHVGSEADTYAFKIGVGWQYIATNLSGPRHNGTSVLIPGALGEIMIIGGHGHGAKGALPPVAQCERIDFSDPTPQWRATGSLSFPRSHGDALILPDKTVLFVGGGTEGLYESPVLTPELYDPQSEVWTPMARHALPRMYHGTTVLLPDGRVLCAGQDNGPSAAFAEIYSPPYLFRGARPAIDAAPTQLSHGQTFDITTPDASDIADVALIRMTAITHSVNTGQRYVELPILQQTGSAVTVGVPSIDTLAPPGPYMLFILNSDGVPSESRIVYVDHAPVACPADFAEPFGMLDFSDVLEFLTLFDAGDPRADLALPVGVFSFTDVVVFLTMMGAGCP